MSVPFLDLKAQLAALQIELDAAAARVRDTDQFNLGEEVTAFEEAFAAFCGTRACVGLDSGLSALEVGLRAAGVGPGDEVITVSYGPAAAAAAITATGAAPVLVDVRPDTYLMDPATLEAAITPQTKAIIPIHLYGQTVAMDPLMALAERHHLFVLEDASQAHGARYQGRRAGSLGHAAAFSFAPEQNLGAEGDAGALTTNDLAFAERARVLRGDGQREEEQREDTPPNRRMDDTQAAILRVKLPHLDQWNAARRKIAQEYTKRLAGLPIGLSWVPLDNVPVWHLYVIRVGDRSALQQTLAEAGIETGVHYPAPIHRQPEYAALAEQRFPVSEWIAAQCLSLPIFADMTDEQVTTVIDALTRATEGVDAPAGALVAEEVEIL
jgi:dTDP-4-amino-4,6-dideoxygalactose transaminase